MSYGYSQRLAKLNAQAAQTGIKHLGVQLGRACIEADIPVSDVARKIGVSRQTIYNWFCGTHLPNESSVETITALLDSFTTDE